MEFSSDQNRFVLTLLLFIIISSHIMPQGSSNNSHIIYLELGGNCILYSFNYERELLPNTNLRMGLSYYTLKKVSNSGAATQARLVTLFMFNQGFKIYNNNSIEIGGGIVNMLSYDSFFALNIGYRYSPINGGLFFKLSYTPILNSKYFDSHTWFGMGIGYRF